MVLSAFTAYYRRFFRDNFAIVTTMVMANRVTIIISFIIYVFSLCRWFRLISIRQNSWMIRFGHLSITEKRLLVSIIPFLINAILRIVKYTKFTAGSDNDVGFWESETESGLIMDVSGQYLSLTLVSSKLL